MIFKATDESEMRITAFKCLEEIIFKRKSLAKLSQYTSDIIKLLTFSYEKQLREITLFFQQSSLFLGNIDFFYCFFENMRI